MADNDHAVLEARLRELGALLVLPPAPDVVAAVSARLVADAEPVRQPRSPGFGRRRLGLVVAAVLVALAALAATPAGQAAADYVLHVFGVDVRQQPSPLPRSVGVLPGESAASLASARRQAAFPILVPAALGTPDAVTVSGDGRVVSLIYLPGPGRPRAGPSGVAARLDEFDGSIGPVFEKFLSGPEVQRVDVAGRPGAWVNGPHDVIYLLPDGEYANQSARLAAQTLIWQSDTVTLRLEGDFTRESAIAVGASAH